MSLHFWWRPLWQNLLWALREQRPAHALLLHTREGLGADVFAVMYARRLLCVTKETELPCEQCAGCHLTAAGTHPDLLSISVDESRKSISIDQVRELISRLQQTAHRGGYRVALIHDAHNLNIAAANALLKTLEEPGVRTVLVLVTSEAEKLPGTVRSRCLSLKMQIPAECDSLQWLYEQHVDEVQARVALRWANGAPLLARDLLQKGGLAACTAIDAQCEQLESQRTDPVNMAQNLLGDLKLNAEWIVDAVLRRCHAGLQGREAMEWARLSEQTFEARRQLRAANNLNAQAVVEILLMRWFDLIRKMGHSKPAS